MDMVNLLAHEDGDGDVAQVDGLLAGLRLMGDGFRCALPILRAGGLNGYLPSIQTDGRVCGGLGWR